MWIVILKATNGRAFPMVEEDSPLMAEFATEDDAIQAAMNNPLGITNGFQVVELDWED